MDTTSVKLTKRGWRHRSSVSQTRTNLCREFIIGSTDENY